MPPPVSEGCGLVCESVGKSDLLSDPFDSKQSSEAVDVPLTCHPSPSLTTLAFRSSEVRRLLFDLDPYGRADRLGMFPLFLKRTADTMAPRHSLVFWLLVRLGSFPTCWRQANVSPIPKGPPSSSATYYRPISITSVLSKVFEHLVSVRLGRFVERSGVRPTTEFAYRKVWVPVMHFVCVPYTASALESEHEARIIQIDFSAAFERVNHLGIIYKLWGRMHKSSCGRSP